MVENTGANEKEGAEAPRHLLDWGSSPGPKGGLAQRREVVIEVTRRRWLDFLKEDIPTYFGDVLFGWAVQHPPGMTPPIFVSRALNEAKDDPDKRDAFVWADERLKLEHGGPIPDVIVQGAKLPKNRKPGNQPKPDRYAVLAIEVAYASWLTGLQVTRNETKEPDPDTPLNVLPSAADLVARATERSYGHVVRAFYRPIKGRSAQYLLDRWEREANELKCL